MSHKPPINLADFVVGDHVCCIAFDGKVYTDALVVEYPDDGLGIVYKDVFIKLCKLKTIVLMGELTQPTVVSIETSDKEW